MLLIDEAIKEQKPSRHNMFHCTTAGGFTMMSNRISEGTSLPSVGWYRWGICALLFFATTLNYIDRQVIGILKPALAKQFGWNEIDYSNIVFAFQIAYAIGYAGVGRLIDRVGVRLGYALAVLFWSLAEMAHALNRFIPPGAKLGDWLSVGLTSHPRLAAGDSRDGARLQRRPLRTGIG